MVFPRWTGCQKMCSRPSLVSCLSLCLVEDQNCPCHRPQGSLSRLFCRRGREGPWVETNSYEIVGASLSLAGILGICGWKAFKSLGIDCVHRIHLINGSTEYCSASGGYAHGLGIHLKPNPKPQQCHVQCVFYRESPRCSSQDQIKSVTPRTEHGISCDGPSAQWAASRTAGISPLRVSTLRSRARRTCMKPQTKRDSRTAPLSPTRVLPKPRKRRFPETVVKGVHGQWLKKGLRLITIS